MSRIRFAGLLAVTGVLAVVMARAQRRPDITPAGNERDAQEHVPAQPRAAVPPQRALEYPSVAAHFDATARTCPGRVALGTSAGSVTYGELLAAAHAARAAYPRQSPSPRAVLVPASLTPTTVATVLGLFAAGTAVVTVDPEMPANRSATIAEILDAKGYAVNAASTRTEPLPPPTGSTDGALCSGSGVDDVTSIQFTSGSTGVPKAVLHTNGLWLADTHLLNDRFGFADGRRVALCMPISFAGGLNVLIGCLVGGAEIVAVDPREYSAAEAFDRIRASRAQAVACTPSFVDALHRAARGSRLPRVERIVTTGEPIQARHVRLARELAPSAVITNWVGSTETLAIASHDIPPSAPLPRGVVPVGIPAPHKHIEISDDGIVSVTSRHLGRGYLDPSASAATFVDNGDKTTTYTGGDVGRWDENGDLVFSGRADNTVKIRGYLVEPAEIEATLASYDDVREVAVVATASDGNPALTAYLAPSTTERTPSIAELRTRLHRDLPSWMVPTNIEILTALPRGDRGKVDRMALPAPTRAPFEPPASPLESLVADLWAGVLCVDSVGRSDSFYALGGDSLSVTQMLVALRETHGIALGPSDLAAAPTVADFAQQLTRNSPESPRAASTTVALRPISAETGAAPLFCFTGAGASALCFVPLAERVGEQTAVYAFEPSGLNRRASPDWSISRAVQRHWTDLRRIQPHGPYTLIGHSLGAHVALETARRLAADGETVELVAMLDPWLSPRVAHDARREIPEATVTLQTDEANGVKTWWERQKTVPLAGLFSSKYHRRTRAVEEIGMIAGYRHRPQPWGGRALLILSHLNTDDPRLWRRLLTGDVQTRVLDCDHHSMVREPHIGVVVDLVTESRACRR